jgi:mannose-6-phosphate isomerase class I
VRAADADSNVLIRSPFFQVEKMRLSEPLNTEMSLDTPHVVVAVNGSGVVEAEGMQPVSFATGESVVIPAGVKEYLLRPQWDIDIMRMSLPVGPVGEPQTELTHLG